MENTPRIEDPRNRDELIRFLESDAFPGPNRIGWNRTWWHVLEGARLEPKYEMPPRWPRVKNFDKAFALAKRFLSKDPREVRYFLKKVHLSRENGNVVFTASDGGRLIRFSREVPLPSGFDGPAGYEYANDRLTDTSVTPRAFDREFLERLPVTTTFDANIESLLGKTYPVIRILRCLRWDRKTGTKPERVHYPNVTLKVNESTVHVSPYFLFDGLQAFHTLGHTEVRMILRGRRGSADVVELLPSGGDDFHFIAPIRFLHGPGRHALFAPIDISEHSVR